MDVPAGRNRKPRSAVLTLKDRSQFPRLALAEVSRSVRPWHRKPKARASANATSTETDGGTAELVIIERVHLRRLASESAPLAATAAS